MRQRNTPSSRRKFVAYYVKKYNVDQKRQLAWDNWAKQVRKKPGQTPLKNATPQKFVIRKRTVAIKTKRGMVQRRRRLIQSESIVERGLRRLSKVSSAANQRGLEANLENLLKNRKVTPAMINRARSLLNLEKKRKYLTNYWERRLVKLYSRDVDFPLVKNRKSFLLSLDKILKKSKPGANHTLVFFDIDSLKKINSEFHRVEGGHQFLITFSNALAKTSYKNKGIVGHVYGDEFLVYLPMEPKRALAFLKEIFEPERQKQLKSWPKYREALAKKFVFNYSAGLLGLKKGNSVSEAVAEADSLCDKAKEMGRETNTFAIQESIGEKVIIKTT